MRFKDRHTNSTAYKKYLKMMRQRTGKILCSYCPYHRGENTTRPVNMRRSWKNYRKTQYRIRRQRSVNKRPLWKQIVALSEGIPEEEWDNIPSDLSHNLDHYLYGCKKKEMGAVSDAENMNLLEIFQMGRDIGNEIPLKEREKVPRDLSLNIDHYLYGAPKKRQDTGGANE